MIAPPFNIHPIYLKLLGFFKVNRTKIRGEGLKLSNGHKSCNIDILQGNSLGSYHQATTILVGNVHFLVALNGALFSCSPLALHYWYIYYYNPHNYHARSAQHEFFSRYQFLHFTFKKIRTYKKKIAQVLYSTWFRM